MYIFLFIILQFQVMCKYNVNNIVFSSSATVYGAPSYLPLDELHPAGQCTNPYGRTKYFIEQILTDICTAKKVYIDYILYSNFKRMTLNNSVVVLAWNFSLPSWQKPDELETKSWVLR